MGAKKNQRGKESTLSQEKGIKTWGPFLICMGLRGFQPLENVVFHLIFIFQVLKIDMARLTSLS